MGRGATVRARAAEVVSGVAHQGKSLNELLPGAQARIEDARDRGLLAAMCFGVLRWFHRLDLVAEALLDRPSRGLDAQVRALLLVGIHQLESMRVPAHAAISESVNAARVMGKPWARGLVNAVLRRFQRERDAVLAKATGTEVGRYSHPGWLIRRLREDWPAHWSDVLQANNEQPPMWLRVNPLRTSAAGYRQRLLGERGLEGEPCATVPTALRLAEPVEVSDLPGFAQGLVSVQDAGAQLAAGLLGAQPGMRVLDACAAPGGKAAHILEAAEGDCDLTAMDIDDERLARVGENLERLQLSARLMAADAGRTGDWWDGRPFERVLLDAPCTGSGVIRRHPDIKLLRREGDVGAMAELQLDLLGALWPVLAPGGRLVYCTCSVFRQENEAVIAGFLGRVRDAVAVCPGAVSPGQATGSGLCLLPGDADTDGFYYACLQKN